MDFVAKAKELRHTVLDMAMRAGTGHVTSSFSCVEPAPHDKYPYGREEVKKEHMEYYEGIDRN